MSIPPPPPINGAHRPGVMENGFDEPIGKSLNPGWLVTLNIINVFTHLLLGAVAFIAITFATMFYADYAFTQHIYLCVLGYIILMSEAILSVSAHTGWTQTLREKQKKVIHSLMQMTGAALAIAGSAVIMLEVTDHFQSAHGILGIVALMLTILSLIGGVVNFFSANLQSFRINPLVFKILHSCLGSLTIIAAFLCLIFGFDHLVFRLLSGWTAANLAIALTVMALGGTLVSAFLTTFKRICD